MKEGRTLSIAKTFTEKRTKIFVKNGVEGPRHDLYGYTEVIYEKGNLQVIYHMGLVEWVKVNGITEDVSGVQAEQRFTELTGWTSSELIKFYSKAKYQNRCRKCGSKKTVSKAGYPGESFDVCAKCGSVVSSYFNESAVI